MVLNNEAGKEEPAWRLPTGQTETWNSGGIFQLIPHTWAVLGPGLTPTSASPLTVFNQSNWCTARLLIERNFIFFKGKMPFWQGLDIGNTHLKRFSFHLAHTVTTGEQENHKEWQTGDWHQPWAALRASPCHQGQPWAHSPTRTLTANISDKPETLFSKILSTWVQYWCYKF